MSVSVFQEQPAGGENVLGLHTSFVSLAGSNLPGAAPSRLEFRASLRVRMSKGFSWLSNLARLNSTWFGVLLVSCNARSSMIGRPHERQRLSVVAQRYMCVDDPRIFVNGEWLHF